MQIREASNAVKTTWVKLLALILYIIYNNNTILVAVSKKDEVTEECRKLHNEELNDQLTKYCSGDKTEKNEMGGACSAYGGEERRI